MRKYKVYGLVATLVLFACLVSGIGYAQAKTVVVEDFEIKELSMISWNTWAEDRDAIHVSFDVVEETRDPSLSKYSLRVTANVDKDLGVYDTVGHTRNIAAVSTMGYVEEGAKSISFWIKFERGTIDQWRVTLEQVTGTRIQDMESLTRSEEGVKPGDWQKITIPFEISEQGFFKWDKSEPDEIFFPLVGIMFCFFEPHDLVFYIDDIVVEY